MLRSRLEPAFFERNWSRNFKAAPAPPINVRGKNWKYLANFKQNSYFENNIKINWQGWTKSQYLRAFIDTVQGIREDETAFLNNLFCTLTIFDKSRGKKSPVVRRLYNWCVYKERGWWNSIFNNLFCSLTIFGKARLNTIQVILTSTACFDAFIKEGEDEEKGEGEGGGLLIEIRRKMKNK